MSEELEKPNSKEEPLEEEKLLENKEEVSVMQQLKEAQAEAIQGKEHYFRALADLENFRRRVAREKEELRKFATQDLMQSLLPVLDNLQIGLNSARNHSQANCSVIEGFQLVAEQMKSLLQEYGLQEINPKEAFDPSFHDCVAHETSTEIPEGHIIKVMRVGYKLQDRLLRPASVVVSSGSEQS